MSPWPTRKGVGAVPDPRVALVLAEAIRGVDGQQANLDNLRSRVGILLSAATIATSFLGGIALDDDRIGWPGLLAVGVFVVHVGLGLVVLWPRKWTFQTSPTVILDQWIEKKQWSVDRVQRNLARWLEKYSDSNAEKLDRLWRLYAAAIAALGVEILLWLGELGGLEGWLCDVICR